MYPCDPIRMAQHNRLMTELKSLFIENYIHSDMRRAIVYRLKNWLKLKQAVSLDQIPEANYFSSARIAIYTSIFGEIDTIHEPLTTPDNCDFFILTDQELASTSFWKK